MKRVYWLLAALFFVSAIALRVIPEIALQPVFTAVSLLVIAVPSLIVLFRWLGGIRAASLFVVLSVFAYLIEYVGVVSGVPYGWFSYSELMGVKLLGVVPALLPLAYVPLVLGAGALAATHSKKPWKRLLLMTAYLVLFDLVLDPGAVAIGLWSFSGGGVYYGVPFINYVGWVLSGVVASWLFIVFSYKRFVPRQLVISTFLLLAFWAGVAAVFSLWIPLVLALVLLLHIVRVTSK